MELKFADLRKEYSRKKLSLYETLDHPIDQFEQWLKEAISANIPEPTAMCLSTVDFTGYPTSRMVLLKGVIEGKLYFFTNYESQKGKELEINPLCSITFYWPELERQININGKVQKASAVISDEYFSTRPRSSQIGAWVSPQSHPIPSKIIILREFIKLSAKFLGRSVPRPPFWGGYAILPTVFNFWQGRPNRLHDRIRYTTRENQIWIKERIAP